MLHSVYNDGIISTILYLCGLKDIRTGGKSYRQGRYSHPTTSKTGSDMREYEYKNYEIDSARRSKYI
jgi:hypothetical protein